MVKWPHSFSELPALKSFCMFCGVGILIVYLLQSTWFVAWMAIDQQRIEARKNGLLVCITHPPEARTALCPGAKRNHLQRACAVYARVLMRKPVKAAVLLFTAATFGLSVWGNVLLRQEFDPMWFLPRDSYLSQWVSARDK